VPAAIVNEQTYDLAGTGKAGCIVRAFRRVFLEHAYKAGKIFAVLPQPLIVWNDYECMLGIEDTRGFQQRIDDEHPRG